MRVSTTDCPTSPLDAVDAAFAKLTCPPVALTLDLGPVAAGVGLPAAVMPVGALRDWMLSHRRAYAARDAVWRELIRRARTKDPAWVVVCTAMALPALRRCAARLCAGYAGDARDIDAELLAGFLQAVRDRLDLERDAPYAGLCMAAWRAGLAFRRQSDDAVLVEDPEHVMGPRMPQRPYGHPDLLIRRAVVLGLVDPVDEQPYVEVRLGRRAIEPIAARVGLSVDALRMRLRRIDRRLVRALADGTLTGVPTPEAAKELARQAAFRAIRRAARAVA